MAQWLRTIQGQLTEFASEVLNEATAENIEEVTPRGGTDRDTSDHRIADDPDHISSQQAQHKISSLEKHIKELQEQLTELNTDMETIEQRHNLDLKSKDEELEKIKNESELAFQMIRKKKENEMGDLQAKLEERFFSVIGSKDEEIGRLNEELEELRSMLVQDSNQNFEMLPARDEEMAERDREIQGLRRQIDELVTNQSSQSSEKVESVENLSERAEELMEKDREIGELRRQIEEMNLFQNQSRQEIESVETLSNHTEELIEKEREIEELRHQIEAMRSESIESRQDHENKAEISSQELELIEKDQIVHELRNQIEQMRAELIESRQEHLENHSNQAGNLVEKDREIRELKKKIEELLATLNDLENKESDHNVGNEMVQKDQQIAELNRQIEEISSRLAAEDEENILKVGELEEELESLRENYEEDKRRAAFASQELQKRLNETMESSSQMREMTVKKMQEIREENERLRDYITQLETKGLEINDERAIFLERKMMETEEKCVSLMTECKKKDQEIRQFEEKISDRADLEEKIKHLESSFANLNEEKHLLMNECTKKDTEIQRLSSHFATSQQDAATGMVNKEKVTFLESRVTALEEENRQLMEKSTQKDHQIQQLTAFCEENLSRGAGDNQKLVSLEEKCGEMEKEQRILMEECRKRDREIERLKAHLLQVEETSTREAIEAQNREETLKEYVVLLENSRSSYSQSFEETNQHYQVELDHLKARLKVGEAENVELSMKYEEEKRVRIDTQNSLISLQSVVRELAADAEKDNAASGHERLRLQEALEKRNAQVIEMQGDLERVSLDKQALEENIEALNNHLLSNRRLVEELELQVTQARMPKNRGENRIDDAILRELFLSYFMAAPDRKNDIALLLAKILEYPPDEYETIQKSLNTKNSAWQPGQRQPSMNIVEQFVRYLEVESESSRTAPQLPLPKESRPMGGQISTNTDIRPSESAATLQNLLHQ